jgi:hypothetical protein
MSAQPEEVAAALASVPTDPFQPVVVPTIPAPAVAGAPVAAPPVAPTPAAIPTAAAALPTFEGAKVERVALKISGAATVEMYDRQLPNADPRDVQGLVSLDDRVRLVGDYRVVGVHFVVDPKTGDAVRMQILKPLELEICPWDPSDPTDTGIVRARP